MSWRTSSRTLAVLVGIGGLCACSSASVLDTRGDSAGGFHGDSMTEDAGTAGMNRDGGADGDGGTGGADGGGGCSAESVFESYGCVSCHSSTPDFNGGGLDLVSEGLAGRLIDRPSVNPSCTNDIIVDLADPGASLLLRTIAPERYADFGDPECDAPVMPLVGDVRVSESDVTCLEEWIRGLERPEAVEVPIAASAQSVLSRTKYLLHGGAITSDELARVTSPEGRLLIPGLEDVVMEWMDTAEFREKRHQFFRLTLQQDPGDPNYFNQFRNTQTFGARYIRANLSDSLIRTAERIADAGEDFRTIVTTNQWEVTTAVLVALTMADNPMILKPSGVWPKNNLANDLSTWQRRGLLDNNGNDVRDWRTVTLVHDPDSKEMVAGTSLEGESYRAFEENAPAYVERLRSIPDGGSLPLRTPRVGFFTSPAFFQTWLTNVDNDFRVTINQAVIVATGRTFSPGDTTATNTDLAAVDPDEFPEGGECYGCHKNLDRMRTAFLMEFDPINTRQHVPETAVPRPDFAFQGHSVSVSTMQDWAQALASHPNFARAWVLKLCQWASSTACDPNDPVVLALATEFEASGFDLHHLFRKFFVSPLSTDTSFAENSKLPGAQTSVARQGHFCRAMHVRLSKVMQARGREPDGTDLCGMSDDARLMSGSLPDDAFVRGAVHLDQPSTMEPFVALSFEALCSSTASEVVQERNRGVFDSLEPEQTLDLMTTELLGLPAGSEVYATQRATLQRMFDAQTRTPQCADPEAFGQALSQAEPSCGLGLSPEGALRNIWTVVCQSPALTAMGL